MKKIQTDTRAQYEYWVNQVDVADDDKRSNGGRIPDHCQNYGTWLRRNDPIAFNVGYNEWARENRHLARRYA